MAAFVEASAWGARGAVNKKGGWEEVEDSERMLELMLSSVERNTTHNPTTTQLETLDLLGAAAGSQTDIIDCSTSARLPPALLPTSVSLDLDAPLPPGCQKCLDLQTGRIYYLHQNNGSTSTFSSSKRLSNVPIVYPASALIDSHLGHILDIDPNMKQATSSSKRNGALRRDGDCRMSASDVNVFAVDLNSPPLQELPMNASFGACDIGARAADMTTVGCANCLMFVMLSATDPRCPNCGSCAALDFLQPAAKRVKQA
eukprot:c19668_g1_i1 orf=74-847(+)